MSAGGSVGQASNGDVELEVDAGSFTLRWPRLGITLGPCRSSVDIDGRDDGLSLDASVHVPESGGTVVVEVEYTPDRAVMVDRLTLLVGDTDFAWSRRVVDGYDSWAYSGVRGNEPGTSFWDALYADDDGRGLAFQALDARRLCTRITNRGTEVRVDAGATPPLNPVSGTWGYLVGEPPSLGLPLDAHDTLRTSIAIGAGEDALTVAAELADCAASSMSARRWSGPSPVGWESWYHYGLFVSHDDVLANAHALRERYHDRPEFDLVQIDDGWQRTYGAWWPNERFPDDLGTLVSELHDLGCRAGLWIAPFRVQPDAPGIGTDHPEWCLQGDDGPLHERRNNTWALDASHPDALEWIRSLGRTVRDWGFEMVKVDFCYLGALEATRHVPRVTGTEALTRGLRALVDGLGDSVYVLGCGMPMLPAVGICHGNRVGHDLAMPRVMQEIGHPVDDGWTGFAGVRAQARNVAARWAQAGRWYDADPEVVMAWGSDGADPAGYPTEVARVLATMAALSAGPFLLADDLRALTAEERAVLEHPGLLDLVGVGPFRPVDLLTQSDADDVPEHAFTQGAGVPSIWVADNGAHRATAWFNWGATPARHEVPSDDVGQVELWTGEPVTDALVVPPHAARVLVRALIQDRL